MDLIGADGERITFDIDDLIINNPSIDNEVP